MKNALYDIPGQRTADGMAPIKGEIPSMKKELLPEESLGDLAVEQMNKQLEMQQKRREQKQTLEQNQRGRSVFRMHTYPVQDSYSMLRKSVLEENKLPNPTDVNVEQWLNYFGVAELAKAKEQERQSEETTNKDVQFAKAMNQFGAALSSSDPVDVKDFEAVLDLLKDSVGDDAKRLEFKSIVEKTIEIKKKISE